jgi:Tol biopolymer transport system component
MSTLKPLALLLVAAAAFGCSSDSDPQEPRRKSVALATQTAAPIAFLRGQSKRNNLFVIQANGTGTRRVTRLRGQGIREFSWAPDGRRITFAAVPLNWNLPYDGIYVTSLAGAVRQIGRRVDDSAGPVWAPKGNMIAYDKHNDGDHQIWVVRADGSGSRRLTPGDDFGSPSWSPDGSRIAYTDLARRGGWFYVMNADGSAKRRVAHNWGRAPDWAPKGSRVAFVVDDEVWIMGADGRERRRLDIGTVEPWDLSWSPNGRSIALAAKFAERDTELVVVDVDRGGIRRLTDNAEHDLDPSWSPDGRTLAFSRFTLGRPTEWGPGEIYVINADGTGERNLTNSPNDETYPFWAPR